MEAVHRVHHRGPDPQTQAPADASWPQADAQSGPSPTGMLAGSDLSDFRNGVLEESLSPRSKSSAPRQPCGLQLRLGHCHHFQQVAVRILEIEATPATPGVDFAIGMVKWPATVGEPFGLHTPEDRIKLRIVNVKSIVMTLASPGIEAWAAP